MLFLFTMATATISCQKDEIISNRDFSQKKADESTFKREFVGDSIILQNPYSVENMTEALSNIKKQNPTSGFVGLTKFNIKASHHYIKFKPRNEEEVFLLKTDSTTHFFDYRLDCEYTDSYLDKRAPENDSITDYYAAIPINKVLPNIPYDIIEELYIPEQDTYFSDTYENSKYLITYKIKDKTDLFNHLIFEAFTLTDNQDEVLEPGSTATERWFFGKKWRPKGTINIWDKTDGQKTNGSFTKEEFVPLVGAQILMRQWFTVDSGITNANGYFQTGTVRGHARYIIQWERHDYSIRSGWFGQAELRGPNLKNQDWNYNIIGGAQEYYGTIHRGAHYYYYQNIVGLRRPPSKDFWHKQIKFAAYLSNTGTSYNVHYLQMLDFQPWPTITIKRYENNTDDIIGTTIHELAHSTHARHGGQNHFIFSEKRLRETYAQTIEWQLTGNLYRERFPTYAFQYNYQYRTISENPYYTSLMVDLIDNNNQRVSSWNGSLCPVDNVSGYTINQVEDQVMNVKHFYSLNNALRDNYNNPTENNLDELFNNW